MRRRVTAKKGQPEADTKDVKDKEKKYEQISDVEMVEFFGRRLLSFSDIEDPFLAKRTTLNRKTMNTKMVAHAELLHDAFLRTHSGTTVTMAIDGGTNVKVRSLDVTIVCEAIGRFYKAIRFQEFSTKAIVDALTPIVEHLKANGVKCTAFVSDHAINVLNACEQLANLFGGWSSGCACHFINLVVKKILYHDQLFLDVKDILDRVRPLSRKCQDVPNIPVEIDTRWWPFYDAIETVINNWHEFVALEFITPEELVKIRNCEDALHTAYVWSRRCERDSSNIFTAIGAYAHSLPAIEVLNPEEFQATFHRNVYTPAVVAAIALFPNLRIELLPAYLRLMTCACLGLVARRFFPDDQYINSDMESYASGSLYRRNRGLATPLRGSPFWKTCPATSLVKTQALLEHHSGGSGSTERIFAVHEKVHSKKRGRLGEEACEAQIAVNDYLKNNGRVGIWDEMPDASHEQLCFLLKHLFFSWSKTREELLVPQTSVTTWWVEDGIMKPYRCKLVDKSGPTEWNVTWQRVGGEQTFNSDIDPWILTREEKAFDGI